MEEQLVSLEVAKLLKEKGFCVGSTHFYSNLNSKEELVDNKGAYYINGMELDYIEAPTKSLAQKWLRDTKGVIVIIDCDTTGTFYYYSSKVISKDNNCIVGHYQRTYEEALEEGLKQALKLI